VAELRIVAGEWRGRRIKVPEQGVRPTADRVREAWMSIVLPWLDGARIADLCAGSGALGLEALSRGAAHCDFVEQDPKVLTTLRQNIAALGAADRALLHRGSALAHVDAAMPAGAAAPWDVAFADPPYKQGTATALAERWLRAPFATIFGVEHEAALTLPSPGTGQTADRRQYGDTAITIYRQEA
jgi:16S rRNA (guanine966-N2)-methyltransferase